MLRKLRLTLYGLALTLATPGAVLAADAADIDPYLLVGSMAELEMLDPFLPTITAYNRVDGSIGDLSDYAGQVVVLNFWATWCAPCRAEMPSLQALQDKMGSGDLEVVTMAFGRHNPAAMLRFRQETGMTTLPLHLDGRSELAQGLGVLSLPHSFILDRDGRVVAQLTGEADWDAPETLAVMQAFIGAE